MSSQQWCSQSSYEDFNGIMWEFIVTCGREAPNGRSAEQLHELGVLYVYQVYTLDSQDGAAPEYHLDDKTLIDQFLKDAHEGKIIWYFDT